MVKAKVTVASADAPADVKAAADIVASGVGDEASIHEALERLTYACLRCGKDARRGFYAFETGVICQECFES